MSEPIRIKISIQPSALPPVAVQRKLYDAVEALRIADTRLQGLLEDGDYEGRDVMVNEWFLRDAKSSVGLYEAMFRELFGGVYPSLPDRVFQTIRGYECRWAENADGSESAVLALELAERSLLEAYAASRECAAAADLDDLECLMSCASNVIGMYRDVLNNITRMFKSEETLHAIVADAELPEFWTVEEIAEWRQEHRRRRAESGIDERLAAAGITDDEALSVA